MSDELSLEDRLRGGRICRSISPSPEGTLEVRGVKAAGAHWMLASPEADGHFCAVLEPGMTTSSGELLGHWEARIAGDPNADTVIAIGATFEEVVAAFPDEICGRFRRAVYGWVDAHGSVWPEACPAVAEDDEPEAA